MSSRCCLSRPQIALSLAVADAINFCLGVVGGLRKHRFERKAPISCEPRPIMSLHGAETLAVARIATIEHKIHVVVPDCHEEPAVRTIIVKAGDHFPPSGFVDEKSPTTRKTVE